VAKLALAILLVAGCGGPDTVCQSAPCGVSSQMYKTCGSAGTQHVQYQFGGKTCDCDGNACTDCASQVASWCSGGSVSLGSDGGVPGVNSCLPGGKACSSYMQCCSQTCAQGACTTCGTQGIGCKTDADCCAQPGLGFHCTGGTCQPKCRADGASCVGSGDCCSGVCSAGTCKQACQYQGQSCTADADCCGKICDVKLGNKCETCRSLGNRCTSSAECCNGATCDSGICGGLDGQCAGPQSTCQPCCARHHTAGAQIYGNIVTTCNCQPQSCGTQCASDFCGTQKSTPVGSPCDACLKSTGQAYCDMQFQQQCAPNPDCVALNDCLGACT
jgi:hypothetical protein